MVLMLLISMAFGQTGNEPPVQQNNVQQWCLNNASLKDQLVRRGGCIWAQQTQAYTLPSVPGKRYVCGSYLNAKIDNGFEGKLLCPDPFGNLDKNGNILQVVYQCAKCVTSNNATQTPDAECMTNMYNYEQGYCFSDASEMMYFHDIYELKQKPGGPIPTPDLQNPIGTPPY